MKIYITTLLLLFSLCGQAQVGLTSKDWEKIANDKVIERDYDGALFGYEVAFKMDSTNHEALWSWANLLANLGYYTKKPDMITQSFEKYEQAHKLAPNEARLQNDWGSSYLLMCKATDDFKTYKTKTIEKLSQAEALSVQSAAYNLACFYALTKDKKNAYYWLDQALSKEYTVNLGKRINRLQIISDTDFDNIKKRLSFKRF